MDTLAVGLGGAAAVALFYGLTGLWTRQHAKVGSLAAVLEEGDADVSWIRVQSNAFKTSMMHPWRLVALGVIGLVAAVALFVAST